MCVWVSYPIWALVYTFYKNRLIIILIWGACWVDSIKNSLYNYPSSWLVETSAEHLGDLAAQYWLNRLTLMIFIKSRTPISGKKQEDWSLVVNKGGPRRESKLGSGVEVWVQREIYDRPPTGLNTCPQSWHSLIMDSVLSTVVSAFLQ